MRKYLFVKGITFVVMLSIAFLPGCGLLNRNSGQQQPQQQEQSDKVPKQLEEMESMIESVFMVLGGPSLSTQEDQDKGKGKEQDQEQGQSQKQEEGKQDQQKQQEGQDKQKQEEGQGGEEQGQEQKKEDETSTGKTGEQKASDPWQQVTQDVKSLHSNWNEYLPEATKKGAKKETIDTFSDALNNLTKTADSKDKIKTLLATNALYANIPDMHSLYKTKSSPELKRVIFHTRNSVLHAMAKDWDKATADIEDLKALWSIVKNTISKEQQEDATKLDLSIYELEKVVKEKDSDLVEIKGKITMTNVDTMQESIEKQ